MSAMRECLRARAMVSSLIPPQTPEVVNRLTKTLKGYKHTHTHTEMHKTQTAQTHVNSTSAIQ